MSTDARNYLKEAISIVKGETRMIPQKEHLIAIADVMERAAAERETIIAERDRIIAAVMLDQGVPQLSIPSGLLEHVATQGLYLVIHHLRGGNVAVELKAREVAAGRQPVSVN